MAAVIIKEVNRMPGYTPSGNILAGQPVKLSDASTIIAYSYNNTPPQPQVLGLALETNVALSSLASIPVFKLQDSRGLVDPTKRPTSDEPSGDTTVTAAFYDQIDRGGLISVALNGAVIDLYDDGRGIPYEAAPTLPYAVNQILYSDNELGVVTSDILSASGWTNLAIGVCLAAPTVSNPILRIKLTI